MEAVSESPVETHRDLGLVSSNRQHSLKASAGQEEEGRPGSVKQNPLTLLTAQIESDN